MYWLQWTADRAGGSLARVVFPESFTAFTDGEREWVTQASDVRGLTAELRQRWPALADLLTRSAVAIDGQIYQDAFLEPIGPESEVFFMARIEGG